MRHAGHVAHNTLEETHPCRLFFNISSRFTPEIGVVAEIVVVAVVVVASGKGRESSHCTVTPDILQSPVASFTTPLGVGCPINIFARSQIS